MSKDTTPVASRRGSVFGAAKALSLARRWSKSFKGRRDSQFTTQSTVPQVKLENTYKIKPDDGTTFKADKIEKIIYDLLECNLSDKKYEASQCHEMTQKLTNQLRRSVKQLGMPRFKLVCHVIVGENKDQGVYTASRCLWDENFDAFATATYTNSSMFAVGTIFGMYFD